MDIQATQQYDCTWAAVDIDSYCGCQDCNDPVGYGNTEFEAKSNLEYLIENMKTYKKCTK